MASKSFKIFEKKPNTLLVFLSLLCLLITVLISGKSFGQTTLVTWTFPNSPDDAIADGGIGANSLKTITLTNANATISFSNSGTSTCCASSTRWDNGNGLKWFEFPNFVTTGFSNLSFSASMKGNNTSSARDYKIQYRISSGSWTDVTGGTITLTTSWQNVAAALALPSACNNQADVSIRVIQSSNISIAGGAIGTGTGAWTGIDNVIISSTPPCNAISSFPWTENFDAVTIPAFPSCWFKEGTGDWVTTNNANSTSDADAYSGTQFLRETYSATNEYMWTPGFSLTAGTSYDFSFWWAGDNNSGWTGDVFYNTSQISTGATQLGASFVTSGTTTSKTYAQVKQTFIAPAAGTFYFAIRVNASSAPWYLSFDDFRLELTPTCITPSAVASSLVTTTSATISWTAPTPLPGSGYQWEVRTSGGAGSGSFGLTASGNTAAGVVTANVSGLSASTTYSVYVRSYCGGSDYSAWTSAYSFSTPCVNSSIPYSQGFNSTSIPTCWTQQYVSGTNNLLYQASGTNPTVSSPFESTQMVYWNSYAFLSGQTRLVSPPLTTTGYSVVLAEFEWYHSTINSTLNDNVQVQYSTDGISWTNAGSPISRYNATAGWSLKSIELPSGAGNQSTVYVGFLFTSAYGGNCYMDAVVIRPQYVPGCAGITSPSNGSTNVWPGTLEWSAPAVDATHGAATGYKVYFGTNNPPTNIENGTYQTGTTYSLGSLTTNTLYYWKIIATNSTGDAASCSQWNFQTAVTVPTISYTVGTGAETSVHYNTIQHAYDHCNTYNPYIIEIQSTYTVAGCGEILPIDLSTITTVIKRSAVNNLIIRPATGVSYTFTNSAAEPVFKFNGAKYVTIDGRPGGTGSTHGITIVNSNTGSSSHPWAVWFNNDACYNTLEYCDLKAGSTNLYNSVVQLSDPAVSGTGNNYNTIIYNNISNNTATYPENGIYCVSYTSGVYNTYNNISYNNIFNFWGNSAGIKLSDKCNNFTIRGNSIYQTITRTPAAGYNVYGIFADGDNHTICKNYVGGTAPSCGGTALTISAAAYDSYFTGIRLSGSSSSTSRVDSNIVSNIIFNTQKWTAGSPLDATRVSNSNSADGAFAGLVIDQGSATVRYNTIGGNTVGNITVINCGSSTSAGNGTEAHGIVTYTDNGTVTISNNTVDGINCYASNTADNYNARVIGIITGASVTSGPTYNITYNTVGSTTLANSLLAGNAAGTNNGDFYVIGIYNESGIGGSKSSSANVYIKGNTVANLCANGNGNDGFVNGILNLAGTLCEIDSNTVFALRNRQATSLTTESFEKRCIVGIAANNDGGYLDHFWVNRNYIYDLKSTCTGNVKVDVVGIYFRAATAPVLGRVFKNRIWSLNASSSDYSSLLEGLWTYGQNAITYDNFITLGSDISGPGSTCPSGTPASSAGYEIRGINNVYGKDEYYYNSVCILGSVAGGSNTYAYKYTNIVAEPTVRVFKDNIFVNMRSNTSGTAKHYAYSITSSETNSTFNSDYNILYTPGSGGVLFDCRGTDKTTLAAWTAATTMDANSIATGTSASDPLFTAPTECTPNLNITNINSPAFGNGTTSGIPSYITDDIFGHTRGGSNDIGAVVIGGSLPIELLVFTAKKHDANSVQLKWVTATETNNDYFTIEKSADGINFYPIVTVDGAGNSNAVLSYCAYDNAPFAGVNYYRLKQTDFDGKHSYSNIEFVNFGSQQGSADVSVFPNPVNNDFYIDISKLNTSKITVHIENLLGQIIYESNDLHSETGVVPISLSPSLPSGYYLVKIKYDDTVITRKIIKAKN